MVGVLVFKKKDYRPKTKDELNVDRIEALYNHLDNDRLLFDIRKNLGLSDEEIENALKKMPDKYEKFESFWRKLPGLRRKYQLAVINNGNSLGLNNWFNRFEFGENFDLFVNSAVEGVKKPDSRIFLLTGERLGVKPEECLFIDDSLKNVQGAKKLGIKGIWWDREIDREQHLKRLAEEIPILWC